MSLNNFLNDTKQLTQNIIGILRLNGVQITRRWQSKQPDVTGNIRLENLQFEFSEAEKVHNILNKIFKTTRNNSKYSNKENGLVCFYKVHGVISVCCGLKHSNATVKIIKSIEDKYKIKPLYKNKSSMLTRCIIGHDCAKRIIGNSELLYNRQDNYGSMFYSYIDGIFFSYDNEALNQSEVTLRFHHFIT